MDIFTYKGTHAKLVGVSKQGVFWGMIRGSFGELERECIKLH